MGLCHLPRTPSTGSAPPACERSARTDTEHRDSVATMLEQAATDVRQGGGRGRRGPAAQRPGARRAARYRSGQGPGTDLVPRPPPGGPYLLAGPADRHAPCPPAGTGVPHTVRTQYLAPLRRELCEGPQRRRTDR
ncbi:hypothetical protein SSCG_01710 [Streptomyces clavuligerus]|nr:hypothetical protein SSCG_01710 [Streptomyces clavuligerus]